MKMKKSVFMLMAVAALVSCSDDNNNAPLLGDDVIRLNSTTLTAGTATRTPFKGEIDSDNKLIALVPSATASGSYSTDVHTATGTMTFNGSGAVGYDTGSLEGPGKASLPGEMGLNDHMFLFGLYPATDPATDPATGWTIGDNGATIIFDGSQDIMAAPEVSFTKTELKEATQSETGFKTLTFGHLLTKLEVKFKASTSGVNKYGNIQAIELTSDAIDGTAAALSTKVTYNPTSSGTATFSDTTEDLKSTLPFYEVNTDSPYTDKSYTPDTTAELQAYCLAAPVTAASDQVEYYIKVTTEREDPKIFPVNLKDKDGDDFATNTAGYSFNITINYTVDDIYVTATVQDWLPGGDTIISAE